MAHEDIQAEIAALIARINAGEESLAALRRDVRHLVADLRAGGLPVPPEFVQFEDDPADGEPDAFDNLPV